MGGLLLKKWNLPEKRILNSEYDNLKSRLLTRLSADVRNHYPSFHPYEKNVGNDRFGTAPCLRTKESHGDLDIMVGIDPMNEGRSYKDKIWYDADRKLVHIQEYLEELSGYKPHVNSNVISFPIDGFQVDVTFVDYDDYQSSVNYNSWGDTSNLMGRIFHKMGLHYGHTGLSFWIRQGMFDNDVSWSDNDHIYEKVVLTKSMKNICEVGGFDYAVWKNGFDTQEEAYLFIANSKYFNKEIFAFENLNNINRVRNKKRPMYAGFVEWLDIANPPDSADSEFLSKTTYSLIFQEKFPILKEKVAKYYFEYKMTKEVKEKINGKIIVEKYGVTDGPRVGKIMSYLKTKYKPFELLEIRESVLDAEIKELIKSYE